MKVSFLVIFVGVILMQSLQGFFTYVDFKMNQEEITAKYCVNKDRPLLRCNGNCYLAKQLKKQDDIFAQKKKENQESHLKKLKEVEFFAQIDLIGIEFSEFLTEFKKQNIYYKDLFSLTSSRLCPKHKLNYIAIHFPKQCPIFYLSRFRLTLCI